MAFHPEVSHQGGDCREAYEKVTLGIQCFELVAWVHVSFGDWCADVWGVVCKWNGANENVVRGLLHEARCRQEMFHM
jgi:hypothetical protein